MTLPRPEPGLVIQYSYLWRREAGQGREEGSKDRPCAIILSTLDRGGVTRVLVVPVTHSPPRGKDDEALELPRPIKRLLGLDDRRSWVVLSESNLFDWPGPDLRRAADRDDGSVAYGVLPPRFFDEMRRRFVAAEEGSRTSRVKRTE